MKIPLLVAALLLVCNSSANLMAAIMYGDFSGDTVMYLDVTESNGTDAQKFGPPEIFGDELNFNPTNFRAQSSGAAVIEDSQLNMTIMSNSPVTDNAIQQIIINEGGDYTLSGLGNAQAVATVGANVQFKVINIDGVPISPSVCTGTDQVIFTHRPANDPSSPNGEFMLPGDQGTAVPWKGNLDYDINALLASCGITNGSATKVEVVLDNTLSATAADGGAAFIAKKDFRGLTITVPEPSSLGLLAVTLLGLLMRRRVG